MSKLILEDLREFVKEEGGFFAPLGYLEEEILIPKRRDLSSTARLVEEDCQPRNFLSAEPQKVRFFSDGVQRSILVANLVYRDQLIPVHYGNVSAMVLVLKDRKLKTFVEPVVREYILAPFSFLSKVRHFPFVDTGWKELDYDAMRHSAVKKLKELRQEAEKHVLRLWAREIPREPIFIDGKIEHLVDEPEFRGVYGLAKSFHPFLFPPETLQKLISLKEGERSALFSFKYPHSDTPVLSWYVRIRDPKNQEPSFGLLRVETVFTEEKVAEADRISRAIYEFRKPVNYTLPKWDKLIYPIWCVTKYLGNYVPSIKTVQYFFRGK